LLLGLLNVLSVSRNNLRRDPCGDWNVVGARGRALTDGTTVFIYVKLQTSRRWVKTKRTLAFMTVTQDGDDEGILKFDGMPTADQAAVIRKVLGLRKVTPLTDEQRDTLARRLSAAPSQTTLSECFIGLSEGAGYPPITNLETRAETLTEAVLQTGDGDAC
jgi:hypothetical protein